MGNVVAIEQERPAKKSGTRKFSHYLESSKTKYLFTGTDNEGSQPTSLRCTSPAYEIGYSVRMTANPWRSNASIQCLRPRLYPSATYRIEAASHIAAWSILPCPRISRRFQRDIAEPLLPVAGLSAGVAFG